MSGMGYMGKIVKIDLSNSSIEDVFIAQDILRKYVGGSGLGAYLLMQIGDITKDALHEDSPLIFMTGPFTGTKIHTSGRHHVVANHLDRYLGESDSGGTWGTKLKQAGYDGLIITGASDRPVYIYIDEDVIEIRDAEVIWGKDTYEVDAILKETTTSEGVVASIGPAGENLVKFAGIFTDGKDARAAGRTGMGAVMGSKKLKAIVVSGTKKIEVFDERGVEFKS